MNETSVKPESLEATEVNEPLGIFRGHPILEIPKDLYIPPEAMEVFLEAFSGPMDLLLYLIRRNNLDILDIPVAQITHQYIEYVELMKAINLELAAEYLVMAATLTEIKSRMLLPRSANATEEEDPRAELVRRLQEYERIKRAAEQLDLTPRIERDMFILHAELPDLRAERPQPEVALRELVLAFYDVMKRVEMTTSHQIKREALSVRERMTFILQALHTREFCNFTDFFNMHEGRPGVVVTFIAMLELIRESLIDIVQSEPFAPIHLRARG